MFPSLWVSQGADGQTKCSLTLAHSQMGFIHEYWVPYSVEYNWMLGLFYSLTILVRTFLTSFFSEWIYASRSVRWLLKNCKHTIICFDIKVSLMPRISKHFCTTRVVMENCLCIMNRKRPQTGCDWPISCLMSSISSPAPCDGLSLTFRIDGLLDS